MSGVTPKFTEGQKRLLRHLLAVITIFAVSAWPIIPMLADWFGSIGPSQPNPSSGQTAFIKGIYAGGYVTEAEAFWFDAAPVVLAVSLICTVWMGKRLGWDDDSQLRERPLVSGLFTVVWLAALLGGGHWLALVFTGSWALPHHHPL